MNSKGTFVLERKGGKVIYRVEKILSPTGEESVILTDDRFKIVEEVSVYLNYVKMIGLSENTIETYCRCLKEYYNWLHKRGLKFYEVRPRNIIDFVSYLRDSSSRQRSSRTINKYLATVSSFYDYYEKIDGYVLTNPLREDSKDESNTRLVQRNSPFGKVRRSLFRQKETRSMNTKRLFPQQIDKLYHSIEKVNKDESVILRNKLIFRLMYETGMRISECLGLRISDYSMTDPVEELGVIYLRKHKNVYHKDHSFKTNERDIPVSMDLLFEIENYISYHRPYREEIETIFVRHSHTGKGMFLLRSSMVKFFNKLSEYSGVKCTSHMLRHTHGTELAENGYQQEYIQDRLGHNAVDSTNKYMHISLEEQVKAYESFIAQRKKGENNDI